MSDSTVCCSLLTLELVAEPDEGPIWLRARGPAGIREFLEAEFGIDRVHGERNSAANHASIES